MKICPTGGGYIMTEFCAKIHLTLKRIRTVMSKRLGKPFRVEMILWDFLVDCRKLYLVYHLILIWLINSLCENVNVQ